MLNYAVRSRTITHQVGRKSSEVLVDHLVKATEQWKQLQGQMRTRLAPMQDRTQYRRASSALMKWMVRRAAWLIPRFRRNDAQPPIYRVFGGPCRPQLLKCGAFVLAHLPDVGKGSGNPAEAGRQVEIRCAARQQRSHRRTPGRTPEGVVYARSVRRIAEHSWLKEDLPSKCRDTTETSVDDTRHASCS